MMQWIFKVGLFILGLLLATCVLAGELTHLAFYYNQHPPQQLFSAYDAVVVQPYADINPKAFNFVNKHTTLYAYVSLGEIDQDRQSDEKIKKEWILGENKAWQSMVMDASNKKWQEFFIKHVISPLVKKGYGGLFLDTVDSYRVYTRTDKDKEKQIDGLVKIIKTIHQKYPKLKLITNRGFHVIPKVHQLLSGVVAESLYKGWNPSSKKYITIPKKDNQYLIGELNTVKNKYKLPVIVISYLPASQKKQYLSLANKIKELGFIPWVTNHTLTTIGVSNRLIITRRVLLIYHDPGKSDMYGETSPVFRYFAMPLNYLGYVPVLYNAAKPLDNHIKNQSYAGIVFYVNTASRDYKKSFLNWLILEKNKKVPIAFFDGFPFGTRDRLKKEFNLKAIYDPNRWAKSKIEINSAHANYETKPRVMPTLPNFTVNAIEKPWVSIVSKSGKKLPVIAKTKWGGYAMFGYGHWLLGENKTKWVVDPFYFVKDMLRLKAFPVPDTTTENGVRLMMTHIDGDGFVNYSEQKNNEFASKIVEDEVLKKYQIPTSVSIIEGEIGSKGLYPKLSKKAEAIARSIFKLNTVEIASHTYSHPFDWHVLERDEKILAEKKAGTYNLPIKNYKFNLDREISGSVNYINKYLAPPYKHVNTFFWSGAGDVSGQAVKETYLLGLLNINGGMTSISKINPSITNVSPLGIYKGSYYQVYSPIGNEMFYTNNWQGPYYGFQNVIQTLKMTNSPLRLKPIDVYYHFYSGERRASLQALKKVLDWTNKQSLMHIFESQYIKKVLDFNNTTISKKTNKWLVHNNGCLKELRISQSDGYPDFSHGSNVIGFSDYQKVRYIHLGPKRDSKIILTKNKPSTPYLVFANNSVKTWNRSDNGKEINASFIGYDPLQISLDNIKGCRIILDKKETNSDKENSITLNSSTVGEHSLAIKCLN